VQTFLPYVGFAASAAVLDDRRLGKQRVETFQILRALTFPGYAWKNHPAVRMWRGFTPALVGYGLACCREWTRRGYADTVATSMREFTGGRPPDLVALSVAGQLPPWLGYEPLHLSHRSALVRKLPEHYRAYFPDVPDDLPYLWPAAAFPRWPVRRRTAEPVREPGQGAASGGGDRVAAALTELGHDAPRAGQAAVVAALRQGRDVLFASPPGSGASTAGLLAGLVLTGPTLWVTRYLPDLAPDPSPPPGSPSAPDLAPTSVQSPPEPGPAAAAGPAARPPSPADVAAMAEEIRAGQGVPEFTFFSPRRLADPDVLQRVVELRPGLVVLDDADELPRETAPLLRDARAAAGHPPALVLAGSLPPRARGALVEELGLRNPARLGGGFDRPEVFLGVRVVDSERRRRALLALACREQPAVVVTASREAAERVAATLTRAGLAAAAVAPGMRGGRQAEAERRFRARRLAALVTVPDTTLDLGRRGSGQVLFACAPDSGTALLSRLDTIGIRRLELLLLPAEFVGVDLPLRALLSAARCRREGLIGWYGEPTPYPCNSCDLCTGEDPGTGPHTPSAREVARTNGG